MTLVARAGAADWRHRGIGVRVECMHRTLTITALVSVALALAACSSTGGGAPTIERFQEGIAEGQEKYPELGGFDFRADTDWACPLIDRIDIAGMEHSDQSETAYSEPVDGAASITCRFNDPHLVDFSFAQAESEQAFAELEDETAAVEQPGNEQTEETVALDGEEYVVILTEFESGGTQLVAHHLDAETLSRTSLNVHGVHDMPDYGAEQVVADLAPKLPTAAD